MNLTPKLRFMENVEHARFHRELVVNPAFRSACEATFAEMVMGGGTAQTSMDASAAAYRIEGARQFVTVLFNLAEMPKSLPKSVSHDNLNHTTR